MAPGCTRAGTRRNDSVFQLTVAAVLGEVGQLLPGHRRLRDRELCQAVLDLDGVSIRAGGHVAEPQCVAGRAVFVGSFRCSGLQLPPSARSLTLGSARLNGSTAVDDSVLLVRHHPRSRRRAASAAGGGFRLLLLDEFTLDHDLDLVADDEFASSTTLKLSP